MSKRKTKKRRHQRRKPSKRRAEFKPTAYTILLDRRATRTLLGGLSLSSLIRLEESGKLTAIKPSGKNLGKTFYAAQQVRALAGVDQVSEVA